MLLNKSGRVMVVGNGKKTYLREDVGCDRVTCPLFILHLQWTSVFEENRANYYEENRTSY